MLTNPNYRAKSITSRKKKKKINWGLRHWTQTTSSVLFLQCNKYLYLSTEKIHRRRDSHLARLKQALPKTQSLHESLQATACRPMTCSLEDITPVCGLWSGSQALNKNRDFNVCNGAVPLYWLCWFSNQYELCRTWKRCGSCIEVGVTGFITSAFILYVRKMYI